MSRLRYPGRDLRDISLDLASLELARERLDGMLRALRDEVASDSRRRRWSIIEVSFTALGAASTVGLAFADPYSAVAVGGGMCSFVGWVAGKRTQAHEPRVLNGASLFLTAQNRLEIFEPVALSTT